MDADRFELLCTDGSRKPLSEYRQCNWGLIPSHALVTSSARSTQERKHYQQFLQRAVHLYSSKPVHNVTKDNRQYDGFNRFDKQSDDKYYNIKDLHEQNQYYDQNNNNNNNQYSGGNRYDSGRGYSANLDSSFTTTENPRFLENGTRIEKFELFESERYGGRLNLMFQDAARNLVPITEDDQSFSGYLGPSLNPILEVRQCPVGRMTLCVTSDAEMDKCIKMRVSFCAIHSNCAEQLINNNRFSSFCLFS